MKLKRPRKKIHCRLVQFAWDNYFFCDYVLMFVRKHQRSINSIWTQQFILGNRSCKCKFLSFFLEMAPVEPLPEAPNDDMPIVCPMSDFCPLTVSDSIPIHLDLIRIRHRDLLPLSAMTEDETLFRFSDHQIDGVLKESFLETLRKKRIWSGFRFLHCELIPQFY
jgi:hypothetical protein